MQKFGARSSRSTIAASDTCFSLGAGILAPRTREAQRAGSATRRSARTSPPASSRNVCRYPRVSGLSVAWVRYARCGECGAQTISERFFFRVRHGGPARLPQLRRKRCAGVSQGSYARAQ